MPKEIIKEKGKNLFGHYQRDPNSSVQEKNKSLKEENNKYTLQEKKNNINKEIKKSSWRKVNYRISHENYKALKIRAVMEDVNMEDLLNNIISRYLKNS